jgi:CTP:molybdopterin cytidylyltransferase MocA
MGRPKAHVRGPDGRSWVEQQVGVLRDGGCSEVTVVLGAGADEARALLAGTEVSVVVADDWAEGMGASLRAGLGSLEESRSDAVLISLVDLPDVTAEVVRRVVAAADGPDVLARASYAGRPGHPVLLGRRHWSGAAASAVGDAGARDYLARLDVRLVECGDLATGEDRDTP